MYCTHTDTETHNSEVIQLDTIMTKLQEHIFIHVIIYSSVLTEVNM